MEKIFSKNRFNILIYSVCFIILFCACFSRFGNILIDTGRELYIPFSMNYFKTVLFKDIICIYGPLPYILNFLITKIFGTNFSVFYCIGAVFAYFFGLIFYFIANIFFSKKTSLLLTLFNLAVVIASPYPLFNYFVPYSYAMLYAAVFSGALLLFSLKFLKTEKPCYFYLSSLFLSLAILSKNDCLALIVPFIFLIFYRKVSFKTCLKGLGVFLAPFLVPFIYILVNHVSYADLTKNFGYVYAMTKSESFRSFYQVFTGFMPNLDRFSQIIPMAKVCYLYLLIPFVFLLLRRFIGKIFSNILFYISLIAAFLFFLGDIHRLYYLAAYIPLLLLWIFIILSIKVLCERGFRGLDFKVYFLQFFVISYCLKTLFCVFADNYGVFYLSFLFIALFVLVKTGVCALRANETFQKISGNFFHYMKAVFGLLFLVYGLVNFQIFNEKYPNYINAPVGKIYSTTAEVHSRAFEIIKTASAPDDAILGLPEGLIFNYALKRKYDVFPTTFTPMDFDAYGEEFLINEVKRVRPKIIFITPRKTAEYEKPVFCFNYAEKFCGEVLKDYTLVAVVQSNGGDSGKYQIFERKSE